MNKIYKNKMILVILSFSMIFILNIIFNNKLVFANEKASDKTSVNESIQTSVNESIKNLLTNFFTLEVSKESIDCSNLVSDKKIAKIYNSKFNSIIEFNKTKENMKLVIDIKDIQKISEDEYSIKFKVSQSFNYIKNENQSKSTYNYISEIKKINNKFYINKLIDEVDYNEFLESNENNKSSKRTKRSVDSNNDKKYIDYLNEQVQIREEFDNEKDKIEEKLKNEKKLTEDNKVRKKRSYHGYYDWSSAVDYAHKHCNEDSYNPSYTRYKSDCQNFVSQCVHAGGIPMTDSWHHYVNSDYSLNVTRPWTSVIHFYNYIKNSGYTWGDDYYHDWKLGDVVQFYNPIRKEYSHSVLLTGTKWNGTPLYSAHTNSQYDADMEEGMKRGGFTNWRYIKFWH